jgi:hypothetical protein
MVTATSNTPNSSPAGILLSTTTPSVSSNSFTQQLAAALEQYLGQTGNQAGLEIDIQPSQSQNSGGSQFLVTVKTASPAPAAATPAASASASPAVHASAVPQGTPAPQSSPGVQSVTANDSTPSGDGSGDTSAYGTAPAGYQNIPFGDSFTTVPTLDTEIAANNKETAIMAKINPDSITNGVATSQAGDPMNGQTVPGGTMKWNDLTQDQQLACQYAMLCGLPKGQSMDQFLGNYAGPKAWWNASYNNPNMFGTPPAAGSVTAYQTPYIDPSA